MAYAAKITKASELGAVLELAKNAGLTVNSVLENKVSSFPADGLIVSIGTSSNYGVNWCQIKNQSKIAKKTAIRDFSVADVLNVLNYKKEVTDLEVTCDSVTLTCEPDSHYVTVTSNNGSGVINVYDLKDAAQEMIDLIED
jgi:hypothetical protein